MGTADKERLRCREITGAFSVDKGLWVVVFFTCHLRSKLSIFQVQTVCNRLFMHSEESFDFHSNLLWVANRRIFLCY